MNTTQILSDAISRVSQCKVSSDEERFTAQLAAALTLCAKAQSERRTPLAGSQRLAATRALIDVINSVLLHRLDRWLRSPEARRTCESATGPARSKRSLARYVESSSKENSARNPDSIPSVLDIAHWFFHDSRLQPPAVATELIGALGLEDDGLLLSKLIQVGVLRNHLRSHRGLREGTQS